MQLAFQQPLIAEIQMEEEPYVHGYQAMNNHIPVIPQPHRRVPVDNPSCTPPGPTSICSGEGVRRENPWRKKWTA